MEKLYETCAKEVLTIRKEHTDGVSRVIQAYQKVSTDKRYTLEGKAELADKLRAELSDLNSEKTDELKDVITKFCEQYKVVRANEKADAQEIANALKVIEMCGKSLTVDTLKSVVEPLVNSHSSLQMISNVLLVKGVTHEVIDYINELVDGNEDIISYESDFESISSLLDKDVLLGGTLSQGFVAGVGAEFYDHTPYEVFSLGDTMMRIGKLQEVLRLQYPRLFK